MAFNVHPIFLHFPIALLPTYAVLTLLPLQTFFPRAAWQQVRRAFLYLGVVSLGPAIATGIIAAKHTSPDPALLSAHMFFAILSTILFLLMAISDVVSIRSPQAAAFLTHPFLVRTLAFLGLVTITLTGMLGGVMVYGTSADPFARIVLPLLGIQY